MPKIAAAVKDPSKRRTTIAIYFDKKAKIEEMIEETPYTATTLVDALADLFIDGDVTLTQIVEKQLGNK